MSSTNHHRSLQDIDGVTACSDCKTSEGKQCVGRTITDENCAACAKGQQHWPCDLKKECWCWDTSQLRDPGDDDAKERACSGCGRGGDTEKCIANMNSLVPVPDEDCGGCMQGQSYWPCDDPDLCWCWDTTKPKKPPAPSSGLDVATGPGPCEVNGALTEEMFNTLAPESAFPYTYEGLCKAIDTYNMHHTEKFAAMGSEENIRAEIAAFLGNTAHESDDFKAAREYLACGDVQEVDGKVYCKPCTNDLYDWENHICSVSMVDQNAPYNSYCQPSFEPPEGCVCETLTQVEEEGPLAGYVEASKVFFGRGAIQLSWNYNYIRASYSLTGEADTFCNNPALIATNPEYAWGSAIYFWMESQKEGTTCHKEILKGNSGDFGGTLNVINGGLECPAYAGGWHASAVVMRINRYCHAASLLGVASLSSFGGCKGMTKAFEGCLADGHCLHCAPFAGDIKIPQNVTTESETTVDTESETTVAPESEPTVATEQNVADTEAESVESEQSVLTSEPGGETSEQPAPFKRTWKPTRAPSSTWTSLTYVPTILVPSGLIGPPINGTSSSETGSSSPAEGLKSPSPTTPRPSLQPTVTPTTGQPSTSTPTQGPTTPSPSNSPTTPQPSYSPTTPQPTMGPCDGEKCAGDMCRSAFGFCGGGEHYCNDSAIWSPECRLDSRPPTPSPTTMATKESSNPPVDEGILDEVFSVSQPPAATPGTSDSYTFDKPTKPTGGKKPVGGKPKPSSSSSSSITPQQTPQQTPYPTMEPVTSSPTQRPTAKVYSPTDPEASYFCGTDWGDANQRCSDACPSSKSDDCPLDQKCFAFTTCLDPTPETEKPTDRPTSPPNTPAPITPAPSDETTKLDGCTGTPCPFAGECRSQYGFCGTSFIYCNALSSWAFDNCGLFGENEDGEPILCDAEVFECPEGEQVYRDPANDCEYFPCPASKDEESEMTSSSFHVPGVPGPSPSAFPELPKPTLPTINKPDPYLLPNGSKPRPAKPTWSSVVVVDEIEEVKDDEEENAHVFTEIEEDDFVVNLSQDWLASGAHKRRSGNILWTSLLMLAILVI